MAKKNDMAQEMIDRISSIRNNMSSQEPSKPATSPNCRDISNFMQKISSAIQSKTSFISRTQKELRKFFSCTSAKITLHDSKRFNIVPKNGSVLVASLKCPDGKILGIIELYNENRDFSPNRQSLLEMLSCHISLLFNNINLMDRINQQYLQICETLAELLNRKDPCTGGHIKRVGTLAEMIAREMGLDENIIYQTKLAAILHDIGKIGIDDHILRKKSNLTQEEYALIQEHPKIGREVLKHIDGLRPVLDGITYHHERYDGCGYPYALKGDDIPLIAQIIAVADSFDAMVSSRTYHEGIPIAEASAEITRNIGKQFRQDVVLAFERVINHGIKVEQKTKAA